MTEQTITMDVTRLPNFMSAWAFDQTRANSLSGCHICTALYKRHLLSKQELDTFSKLTFWGLKHKAAFTQFYRAYFGKVLDKWAIKADDADWLELRSWAKHTLGLIEKKRFKEAFTSFMERVVVINETVNKSLALYTLPEIDCYLGAVREVVTAC